MNRYQETLRISLKLDSSNKCRRCRFEFRQLLENALQLSIRHAGLMISLSSLLLNQSLEKVLVD